MQVEVSAADLKQRSLAGFMRGDQSDSDNGDDEEQLDSADEGGAVRYEVEDVCAVQHDQVGHYSHTPLQASR